jgi:hypothetical protein
VAFDGVILLVGDDAGALGALASRLELEHGVRAGIFLTDPGAPDAAATAIEMAEELYASRSTGSS